MTTVVQEAFVKKQRAGVAADETVRAMFSCEAGESFSRYRRLPLLLGFKEFRSAVPKVAPGVGDGCFVIRQKSPT